MRWRGGLCSALYRALAFRHGVSGSSAVALAWRHAAHTSRRCSLPHATHLVCRRLLLHIVYLHHRRLNDGIFSSVLFLCLKHYRGRVFSFSSNASKMASGVSSRGLERRGGMRV